MSERKININGEVWRYKVGAASVRIVYPEGKTVVVDLQRLTGRSSSDIERGRFKAGIDGMIKPSDIKQYILTYCRIQK